MQTTGGGIAWGGGVSSVTGENPGNVEGALASQGATGAQRAGVGKRRGSWLDASPLAPPLPRIPAAEDRVRLGGNSWPPRLREGNTAGNLYMSALKLKPSEP